MDPEAFHENEQGEDGTILSVLFSSIYKSEKPPQQKQQDRLITQFVPLGLIIFFITRILCV